MVLKESRFNENLHFLNLEKHNIAFMVKLQLYQLIIFSSIGFSQKQLKDPPNHLILIFTQYLFHTGIIVSTE